MSASSVLTDIRVREIFTDCFEGDPRDTIKRISAKGIRRRNFTFHPRRVDEYRNEIHSMLDELPDLFKKSKGGGACFVFFGHTRRGVKWTNSYDDQEKLVLLGVAAGLVEHYQPRVLSGVDDSGHYLVVKL